MANKQPLFPTAPLHIVDLPADANHYGGKREGEIEMIILHATGGTDSGPWLSTTSPLDNPVSVQRLIKKDGLIVKIVEDDDEAYHAGYGLVGKLGPKAERTVNDASLGIELENLNDGEDPYPSAQIEACADQIVEWFGRYGILPILTHAQIDPRKDDPAGFPRHELDAAIARRMRDAHIG